ncbi:MAG: LamG-like jellyroll fold domain-containing protein [Verrucomicrobiales bacterium]
MRNEELESLIDSLLDADLSEADFLRLEAEMQLRPEARQLYYEKLRIDTLLGIEADQAAKDSELTSPRRALNWHSIGLGAAAAALLLGSAISGWLVGNRPEKDLSVQVAREPLAVGFGVVSETADAVWEDGTAPIDRSDLLPPGRLKLDSGLIKLDLFSGVNVIVEGPAEFELLSSMVMSVARGKVRAEVPEQAQGFRIETAGGQLVDLGTEFSMDVSPTHTDLHVLDGEIEWHPAAAEVRNLKQGEALRWSVDGEPTGIALEDRSIADIESSLVQKRGERHGLWLTSVQDRTQDPRLLAFFPMSESAFGSRSLKDESGNSRDATIVQAQRVADRWGAPGAALDFSPTGSRARLILPGVQRSLTFVCWARIDSLDRQYNSLFLTDGHEIGEPHWQIMHDGRLFFSVKKRDWESPQKLDKHIFFSPPIWDPSLSGRWMQIATTYDVDARLVTFYIDGKAIKSEAVPDGYLVEDVKIGAASIGNWSEPEREDPSFAVRNLNGAIDEFSIYSEALSAEEIAVLFKTGKP